MRIDPFSAAYAELEAGARVCRVCSSALPPGVRWFCEPCQREAGKHAGELAADHLSAERLAALRAVGGHV